jgi:hypothetical protein
MNHELFKQIIKTSEPRGFYHSFCFYHSLVLVVINLIDKNSTCLEMEMILRNYLFPLTA